MQNKLKKTVVAAGLLMLAIVITLAIQVDDWNRDLITNRAATARNASDSSLQTLVVTATVDEVREAVKNFVSRSDAWQVGEDANDGDDRGSISLTRTSRLFRFVDDVVIYLQPAEGGTAVDVASQSRVGKGDLGQNPRNIRELLAALRKEFKSPSQSTPVSP